MLYFVDITMNIWRLSNSNTYGNEMKVLIKNGLFLDPFMKTEKEIDILMSGTRIRRIGKGITDTNARVIDAQDKLIFPGLIDVHVHFREPGQEHKETIATGMRAAAAGGFTTVIAEPNTSPPIDTPTRLKRVLSIARKEGLINYFSKACITKRQMGKKLTHIEQLKNAGAAALSDDGHPVPGDRLMYNAFKKGKEHNIILCPHCEESEFYRNNILSKIENRSEKRKQPVLFRTKMPHSRTYQDYRSEPGFIERDIKFVRRTGAKYHASHVSLAESIEHIAQAKREGLPVTAEATPHHLFLNEDDEKGIGPNAKVNPPLRSKKDNEALKQAIVDGIIDVIATDHAPHTPEEKAVGDDAPYGIIGLETSLGLALTYLVKPGLIDFIQLAHLMSYSPNKIFGLNVGDIEEGRQADFTLVDPEKRWTVDVSNFYSKGRNCPFHGRELQGKAVMTVVGGRIVMKDGKILETMEDFEKAID